MVSINPLVIGLSFRAHHIDPNDHLSEYFLALQKANACKVQEAIRHVKSALLLRADHVPSLHLLILLLSAQKQHHEALTLAKAVLEEYPDNLNIMYVQAHLELEVHGGEVCDFHHLSTLSQFKKDFVSVKNFSVLRLLFSPERKCWPYGKIFMRIKLLMTH